MTTAIIQLQQVEIDGKETRRAQTLCLTPNGPHVRISIVKHDPFTSYYDTTHLIGDYSISRMIEALQAIEPKSERAERKKRSKWNPFRKDESR